MPCSTYRITDRVHGHCEASERGIKVCTSHNKVSRRAISQCGWEEFEEESLDLYIWRSGRLKTLKRFAGFWNVCQHWIDSKYLSVRAFFAGLQLPEQSKAPAEHSTLPPVSQMRFIGASFHCSLDWRNVAHQSLIHLSSYVAVEWSDVKPRGHLTWG